VRTAESKQHREVVMTLNEARDLHNDITKLLLAMESLRAKASDAVAQSTVTEISIDGGQF